MWVWPTGLCIRNANKDLRMEKEHIKRAIKGDERSFEYLVKSVEERAYNIALRYMGNREDALDAMQEAFIKVYRNLPGFRMDSSFSTWVYRIVVNTCKDNLKVRARRYQMMEESSEEKILQVREEREIPEDRFLEREEAGNILKILNNLSSEHREILVLKDVNQLSYEEISQVLDINIGTVRSRISRAREAFKKIYTKQKE